MHGEFKFDFCGGTEQRTAEPSENAGNEIIEKLINRSKVSNCSIVKNVPSKQFQTDKDRIEKLIQYRVTKEETNDSQSLSNSTEPQPLSYHIEKIDMICNIDPMCYIIPQHTFTNSATDLIPGVYEGGLKVWECSVDLCRFLSYIIATIYSENATESGHDSFIYTDTKDLDFIIEAVKRSLDFGGSTMELGCGHGLPGCLILRETFRKLSTGSYKMDEHSKADSRNPVIIFSDFNDFVLQHATIPNIYINTFGLQYDDEFIIDEISSHHLLEKTFFVSGDWMGLSHKLSNESGNLLIETKFDIILASETTYTIESCQDTAFLLLKHLKIGTGVGLVATKRYYFGVGGGTKYFFDAIKMLNNNNIEPFCRLYLLCRTIRSHDTGNANIRDILEVRCLAT